MSCDARVRVNFLKFLPKRHSQSRIINYSNLTHLLHHVKDIVLGSRWITLQTKIHSVRQLRLKACRFYTY